MVSSGSTTAVFVMVPTVAARRRVDRDGGVGALVTAPPVQVTVWPATPQTNRLVPLALMLVRPAGTVSTTLTPVALAVPALLTVRV